MEIQAGEEHTPSPGEEEVVDEAVETPDGDVETPEEAAIDDSKVDALEQEIARLRDKVRDQDRALDFMQQVANRQQQEPPKEPEPEEEELVDWRTVKNMMEKQKQEFALERQKEKIVASEEALRKEVPEWPEIYESVVKQKYESDPEFRNYIISRPDPARAAFKWAQEQEAYVRLFGKRQAKKTSGEDIEKAERNAKKPKTLSELGSGSEKKTDWANMSREEFLKIANQNSYD